jgi:hypothetical protein
MPYFHQKNNLVKKTVPQRGFRQTNKFTKQTNLQNKQICKTNKFIKQTS